MGNGLQVPTEAGRFCKLSVIMYTCMLVVNRLTLSNIVFVYFTRKGRHLARCSLRLATCTGFGIGRTWYVPTLIILVLYNYNSKYFASDITVVCVLSDEEDMWHDALSDSQLVRASELVEPGTFSFLLLCLSYMVAYWHARHQL